MSLSVQPIKVHFNITKRWERPFYTGSLWRGLFGHSLKTVSCMTNADTCHGCPLTANCSYYRVFEPKGQVFAQQNSKPPPPYVINPPAPDAPLHMEPGDPFTLEMNLLGQQAIEQLPIIFSAWKMACKMPIANSGNPFALQAIEWLDLEGKSLGVAHTPHELSMLRGAEPPQLNQDSNQLDLHLVTPLRMRVQKRYLQVSDLTAESLIKALLRRTHLLETAYGQAQDLPDEWQTGLESLRVKKDLRWVDWQRWSNRQNQHMKLGGLMGHVSVSGDLQAYLPALKLLPWVNLGKNCSFGLGRIVIR